MFIQAHSNITPQHSFRNRGFSAELKPLNQLAEPVVIDWSEFIPRPQLRRMSPILKSSIACAMDCKSQWDVEWEGIIVGTGLGCIMDTEKFLDATNAVSPESLIPPTSFIQSTHNTVAGQISILTKNHAYNMTHAHRFFSFENTMLDAKNLLQSGKSNLLVGVGEETIPLLSDLAQLSGWQKEREITGAAAFFTVSSDQKRADVQVKHLAVQYNVDNLSEFLQRSEVVLSEIDWVLDASLDGIDLPSETKSLRLVEVFGCNLSLSGLGMATGVDAIVTKGLKKVLVLNRYQQNYSLILLENVEA